MNDYFDQKSRLNYGALLYPDYGYELSFAVGCTYSLDFEALISVPLSLGAIEQSSSETMKNPFSILEGIRRSTDKIAIFCNCDGIKMLRNIKPVYAMLDNSVFPVNLGDGKNFHPKIWVIRYKSTNNEPDMIKVLILSRNLTFDRSMDLVVELKGLIKGRIKRQSKQKPIADLLCFLADKCETGSKAERIKSLADDVCRVDSFDIGNDFDDYSFYITGIPNHEDDSKIITSPCERILIVSPFLAETVVANMVKDCSKFDINHKVNRVLISRRSSITPSIFSLFDEVYVPTEGLEDDSLLEENEDYDKPKRELHAKVIFKKTSAENAIFIGSFNATRNALNNNVEFMVRFKYKPYKASLDIVKNQFVNGSCPAFMRLHYPSSADDDDVNEEEMTDFSDVVSSVVGGMVRMDDNGSYSTVIHFKSDNPDVSISPLFIEKNRVFKEIRTEIVFDHMKTRELSELFIVRKNNEERIIKISIDDLPVEERNDAVFSELINTQPKLLQYVLFLLSDDPELATLEVNRLPQEGSNGEQNGNDYIMSPTIYERMLLAAAREPEKIKAIKDAIKHFDEEKIDKGFVDVVNCFDSLIGD